MKRNYPKFVLLFLLFATICSTKVQAQLSFLESELDLNGQGTFTSGITSLTYGPDGRLYATEYTGLVHVMTIQRDGTNDYKVTAMETLTGVQGIQNHNDDGTNNSSTLRETTGLAVAGTAANPIIYVASSDIRVGGATTGDGDTGLDTNSGTITRFFWNGSSWDVADLVRGLPRSEENHATNGLEFVNIGGTNYLIVAQGGNANGGSPSINFALLGEYALSAAILAIDLDAIEAMTDKFDNGRVYKYNLPTLDDPTRANANGVTDPGAPGYNGIDVNDPFGGNDGLNQAKVVAGGPVKILSPGYRNAYDLVVTESGALYVTDNGANEGWGGLPENQGTANVTNAYRPGEPGGDINTNTENGEGMDNEDHLELITTDIQNYTFNTFYGGHPNPTRANPTGAGLLTSPDSNPNNATYRTLIYDPSSPGAGYTDDPSIALPADWPPVEVANPVEGDWRGPSVPNPDGPDDQPIAIFPRNSNGIDEYTASNGGDFYKGNLIVGKNNGILHRVVLNPDGSLDELEQSWASGLNAGGAGNALGISCNSDLDPFPGTIWVGLFNTSTGGIIVLEPQDFVECLDPSDPEYDANADYDFDGFTNQDEEDNGTDPCNGGSQPSDFDDDSISDLNDNDDDDDSISDANDPFQLGNPNVGGSDAFELPVTNDLYSDTGLGGYLGLGLTGMMNNGDTANNWLDWLDKPGPNPDDLLGGAIGALTMQMGDGTAFESNNDQEKAFQYGVQVDQSMGGFTVHGQIRGFDITQNQLYTNANTPNGELGIQIGDGTQDNYIKFVATPSGLVAQQEIGDSAQTPITFNIPVPSRPSSSIDFYFVVDAVSGDVSLQYELDGGSRTILGTITAEDEVLDAIQLANTDLAVGVIGTSNASGFELEGTWEFLYVKAETPTVVQGIPDIEKLIDSVDENINLDVYFDDDNGAANLTYNVQGNTNNQIGASITDNILTLSFPSTAEVSNITIRATDQDLNFVDDTFTVTVTETPPILYRVNAGGPLLSSIDGDIDWGEDTKANNSIYLAVAGTNSSSNGTITTTDGSVNTTTTPDAIFDSERYDNIPGSPNMLYSFPVAPQPGNYEVRLYMGDGFAGTSLPGQRIFDVSIEGVVMPLLNNVDLSETYGPNTGTMISHIVKVTDGVINIEFLHGLEENPLVNGIEILDASDSDTPIYVNPIADQLGFAGDDVDGSFALYAAGGDGNLDFSATGLPPGVDIEPTNGHIFGTIEEGAFSGSPYNVTITVDDSDGLTSDQVEINFVWEIVEPYMYRINAGGVQVVASDLGANWEDDLGNGAQTGNNYTVNTGRTEDYEVMSFNTKDSSIPAYIDSSTYLGIFNEERYDLAAAPEMEYVLTVENGDYMVNLYMGNSFDGTGTIGDRVFDIFIEGALVENDLDLVERFGQQVGGMISYPATVNDGGLNISFGHVTENPLVNAIEVYAVDTGNPTLTLASIPDQDNGILDTVDFNASASGGDSGENITYYISGQPQGININPSTGQISGTINAAASTGGPNSNGTHAVVVTAVKPLSAPSSQAFIWNVETQFLWTDKDENENYTARHENSFVQAGDKFYLMGGREEAQTIDIYDYTTDSWTSLTDSAPEEFNHFQATEYQGLIWVIGAFKDNLYPNEVPAEYIWMFNPATQEWIQGPEIPAGRQRGSTGLVVYDDKFYIVGGNNDGHDGGYVAWFDEYDPATGTWTPLADAPRARDHFAAVVIGDKLYAAGGRLSGPFPNDVFKPVIPEVDVYDFTSGTWSTLPNGQNIPTPRAGAAAVNFNNRLVVIGGEVQDELVYGVNTDDALAITEEYDPVTQSWDRLADMNFERHGTQAIVSGPGVHILGGSPNRAGGNQKNMEFLGEDSPVGSPSVVSVLSSENTVVINDGETVDVDLNVIDGNIGIFVTSMEITGANAADFAIESGELTNALINPNSTHSLSVSLSGTGPDRIAILTINYDDSSTYSITLTNNPDASFGVTNPGDQYNYEGDVVSLQIQATSPNNTSFSATGLPPDLTINTDTGIITGTIDDGFISGSGDNFIEENGLVVIEAESGDTTGWDITNLDGATGIIANTNSFNNINAGTIPYEITITQAGVYRFNWKNFFSGPEPADENDSWLRFPNNDDVWFFAIDGTVGNPGTEADIIANLQGAQSEIVFPIGSSRVTPATTPDGAGADGYFKVYRSGGTSEVYDWQARTYDNDNHEIFVWFVNPGTYTMEVSERSLGHAIDRMVLYKVDEWGYNNNTNAVLNAPESQQGGGVSGPGAADDSPYNVSVTVTDDGDPAGNETIDFVWYIGEPGDLIAVPQADVTSGFVPLTVNFTGSNSLDDVGVTSYLWEFNDGTGSTSDQADPTYEFTQIGTYVVDLTVGDGDTFDTKSITIEVNGTGVAPTALASAIPTEGDAPLEVVFDGTGSTDDLAIDTYSWDFIDGGTSTEASPTYTFNTPGVYNVELTVTDVEGLTDTDVITITVNQPNLPPVALATASPESGIAPLEVSFIGSGSTDDVGIITYAWDFMDGGTSAEANPTYTFNTPGTYDVELTVTDGGGLTDTDVVTITVSPNVAPVAVATATPETGTAPLEVAFIGSGSTDDVGVVSYAWDFMDGGATSTEADPTYTFSTPGTYDVELTVTDAGGLTDTDIVTVTVSTNEAPMAVATATPETGTAPLEVAFTGSGSTDDVGIVSYAWDFTDGGTSIEMNPTYTFITAGTYDVELTVTDGSGLTDTDIVTIQVTELGGNQAPEAVASAIPLSGVAPLEVAFTGSNSTDDNGVVSYAWDFMDGGTSDVADPTHTFDAPGTYDVELTVTDGEGLFDTVLISINVTAPNNEAPVAVATATPESGETPLEVVFTGSTSTDDVGIATYAWDFNDGGSSAEADPTHTFNVAGTYQVTLTVTDAEGLMDTATITIEVTGNEAPIAVATASLESGNAPLEVVFTGSNSTDDVGVVSYAWDFDDNGASSTEADPTYTFETEGTYEVTLTVTDAEGAMDSTTITIEVGSGLEMEAIVAPNPVRIEDDYASLRVRNLNGATVTKINLHDAIGRLMESHEPAEVHVDGTSGDYAIPIFTLRDGLYYITVELSEGDPIGVALLVRN
ncbi:PKD domain-containing protein [Allomuricauda sp. CAU 1633]|uniref:PKD domain-containing protein n=1 Tax=Allomuricauda sp. CAU 1633 TaxID=2816036 RepID=UPI001F5C2608|nr:PKD domain-containing protein [Muricauda sp. CAU 1633]